MSQAIDAGVQAPPIPALLVDNLRVTFRAEAGPAVVIRDMTYELYRNEFVGIVGESGSGKSIHSRAVLGLLPSPPALVEADGLYFEGRALLGLPATDRRELRGTGMGLIPQDAIGALNPRMRVGNQIAEALRHRMGLSRVEATQQAVDLLARVGIGAPKRRAAAYPHELSGGMAQRVVIAMAIALKPRLIYADEPTSALDVTIQAQIVDLLLELQSDYGMTIALITHDLPLAVSTVDRILVMYAGQIVEDAPSALLRDRPLHPYTMGLVRAVPRPESGNHEWNQILGNPVAPADVHRGCAFAPRCEFAMPLCFEVEPSRELVPDGRVVSCHRWEEI